MADLALLRTCAALSSAAYDPHPDGREAAACAQRLGLSEPVWFEQDDTEAFVAHDALRVFVAFRGTTSRADVRTDLQSLRVAAPLAGTCHRGFRAALRVVQAPLMEHLARLCRTRRRVIYTGHSLGGALATLAAAAHCEAGLTQEPPELVTFGSPRVGCGRFACALDERLRLSLRVVNNNDAPARVPLRVFALLTVWLWPALYTHVGRLVYLDRAGELCEQPPLWRQLSDGLLGRLQAVLRAVLELLWAVADGAADHPIVNYVDALEGAGEKDG